MRKIILLMYLPFVFKGQDTIFKKDNTTILCKVTKATTSMIFYTENKIGKSISLSDVSRYTSNQTSTANSTTNNDINTNKDVNKVASDCDIKVKYDKFENDSTFSLDFAKWLYIIKVKKEGRVDYFMRLENEGTTANYYKTGVIIMLSDGSKIEKPDVKVECEFRAGVMYDYHAFFRLTKSDLELLSKYRMTDWRLFIYDRGLGEKRGEKLREQILCLIKA